MKRIHLKTSNAWLELEDEEHALAMAMGNSFSDPEQTKSFWLTLLEKKTANPKYSLFDDFPHERKDQAKMARKYGSAIIEGLKRGKIGKETEEPQAR